MQPNSGRVDLDALVEEARIKADIWRKEDMMAGIDYVNHPPHYNKGGIETIDAIKASMGLEEFAGYLKGNVIKYVWRYRDKDRPVQDLAKAHWYLDRLIDLVKENPDHDWIQVPELAKDLDKLKPVKVGDHTIPNAVYLGKPGEGHDPSPDDLDK